MCTLSELWTRYAKRRYAKSVLKAVQARWNTMGWDR